MKSISSITLYDMMAQDLDVWVSLSDNFGFKIEIDAEDGQGVVEEEGVHPSAADAFADFCRRYLASYDRVNEQQQ